MRSPRASGWRRHFMRQWARPAGTRGRVGRCQTPAQKSPSRTPSTSSHAGSQECCSRGDVFGTVDFLLYDPRLRSVSCTSAVTQGEFSRNTPLGTIACPTSTGDMAPVTLVCPRDLERASHFMCVSTCVSRILCTVHLTRVSTSSRCVQI